MAFLGRLFKGSGTQGPMRSVAQQADVSAKATEATISTIQQLADNEDRLTRRRELLEKKIAAELERAREYNKQGKKQQALQCLKRKKMLEAEINSLDNMIMRVIEQRSMLESQRTTVEVVSNLHRAALAAKDNLKTTNIEHVDKVIDDINETNEQMKQMQDVFATPTGIAAGLDEDELMNELQELEAADLDQELAQPAPIPAKAHAAPAGAAAVEVDGGRARVGAKAKRAPAQAARTREEEELEALQAEMAM